MTHAVGIRSLCCWAENFAAYTVCGVLNAAREGIRGLLIKLFHGHSSVTSDVIHHVIDQRFAERPQHIGDTCRYKWFYNHIAKY